MHEISAGTPSVERQVIFPGATEERTDAVHGPRLLFFSGGSALRGLSHELKTYTHNSIHIITAFDSGGSSAPLRDAFGMLAIGDLRNRLLALVDEGNESDVHIARALSYRLPQQASPEELRAELQELATGTTGCLRELPDALRAFARQGLGDFIARMPQGFDLRGASLGNLILASRYLSCGRDIEKTIAEFSALTNVRGVVLPVVDEDLTLVAHLADGTHIAGQHLITRSGALSSRIDSLSLAADDPRPKDSQIQAHAAIHRHVQAADLICFPMGSFFTSVLANLLPAGMGQAVAAADCRKVYVPNAGEDPEEVGYSIEERIDRLQEMVARDCHDSCAQRRAVDTVLIDSRNVHYPGGCHVEAIRSRGVDVLDVPLALQPHAERLDPRLLAPFLCALAGRKAA